jgi:predicted Zn finger-like uncharacterized protein
MGVESSDVDMPTNEPFILACPECKRAFRVFPDNVGKDEERIVKCTKCGAVIIISFADQKGHGRPGKHIDVFEDNDMRGWIEEIMEDDDT